MVMSYVSVYNIIIQFNVQGLLLQSMVICKAVDLYNIIKKWQHKRLWISEWLPVVFLQQRHNTEMKERRTHTGHTLNSSVQQSTQSGGAEASEQEVTCSE